MTTETSAEELQTLIDGERAEHDRFRGRVRDEVLRQHFDGPWCLPGSQDVLTDLGLPPIATTYSGSATMRVRIREVSGAANRDEAAARIKRALEVECTDAGIEVALDYVEAYLDGEQVDDR